MTSSNIFCETCANETRHIRQDFGYGYQEYGSKDSDHTALAWECQECGALVEDGGEADLD